MRIGQVRVLCFAGPPTSRTNQDGHIRQIIRHQVREPVREIIMLAAIGVDCSIDYFKIIAAGGTFLRGQVRIYRRGLRRSSRNASHGKKD